MVQYCALGARGGDATVGPDDSDHAGDGDPLLPLTNAKQVQGGCTVAPSTQIAACTFDATSSPSTMVAMSVSGPGLLDIGTCTLPELATVKRPRNNNRANRIRACSLHFNSDTTRAPQQHRKTQKCSQVVWTVAQVIANTRTVAPLA